MHIGQYLVFYQIFLNTSEYSVKVLKYEKMTCFHREDTKTGKFLRQKEYHLKM